MIITRIASTTFLLYPVTMTITTFILFIIIFLAPSVYQRTRFALQPDYFLKISLRKKVGLQIHHAHWGLIWLLISNLFYIFGNHSIFAILLSGLGWGLILDEIIPHLKMPSDNRALELEVYKKSTKPTFILIGIATIAFVLLFLLTAH